MGEGVRFLLADRILLGAITLDLFAVLFGGAVALLPVFAEDILKVGPEGFGLLRAAPAAGALVASGLLAVLPPLRRAGRALLLAVAGFGLTMIGFALSRSFALSLLLLAASGGAGHGQHPGALDAAAAAGARTHAGPGVVGEPDLHRIVERDRRLRIGAGGAPAGHGAVGGSGRRVTLAVVGVIAWRAPDLRRLGPLVPPEPDPSSILTTPDFPVGSRVVVIHLKTVTAGSEGRFWMGRTMFAQADRAWWIAVAVLAGCGTGGAQAPAPVAPIYGSLADSRRGYEVRESRSDAPEPGGLAMAAQEDRWIRTTPRPRSSSTGSRMVRCYDQAGEARDFAGGPVTLRWVVAATAGPTGVHVLASSLGSFEVERCLTEIAGAVRFPRPHGHGKASVEYSLEFRSTGEVPVVELRADAVSAALPALLGRLASECHELGVDEVTATMYVDRKGTVRSLGFGSRRAFPAESAACVARTVRGTPIPVAIEGGAVGRVVLSLRDADVRNPPKLVNGKSKRRATQGRRNQRRRSWPRDGDRHRDSPERRRAPGPVRDLGPTRPGV